MPNKQTVGRAMPRNAPKQARPVRRDVITQPEIRAVAELFDLAHDLAVAVRARMEAGARLQRGLYTAYVRGGRTLAEERKHREEWCGLGLSGLNIEIRKAAPVKPTSKGARGRG